MLSEGPASNSQFAVINVTDTGEVLVDKLSPKVMRNQGIQIMIMVFSGNPGMRQLGRLTRMPMSRMLGVPQAHRLGWLTTWGAMLLSTPTP